MSKEIEVRGGDYEHVLGFGASPEDAPAISYRKVGLGDLSRVVLSGEPFDVAEYSLANYIMLKDRGDDRLTAIPVFPSRAFRNASIFVTADSPLRDVRELVGKKVGVSDFAMTTAVWTRGHLFDDVGLDWKEMEWITAANPRFPSPAGVRSSQTSEDLEGLLLEGKIDALMAGRPRDMLLPPARRQLRFLLDDTEEIERRYFATTGIFPIMHTVVLHQQIAQDKQAPKRIFDTYVQTKKNALKRRLSTSFLPFSDREWEKYYPSGAADPYAHGLTELNRKNIDILSRYLLEQKLIERVPVIDDLFASGSVQWQDN